MDPVLLIDIGSTYTKVTAVDIKGAAIIGSAKAFTTVDTGIETGLQNAVRSLHSVTGKLEYSGKFACSSAAGGLKMIAAGLVPDLTAEAAKRAALSAGAKVLKTYCYELSIREAEEIQKLKPDIVLLSGGTDGGNKNVILHNAEVLSEIDCPFTVVAAGNKSAEAQVYSIIASKGKQVSVCENVMPEFNTLNIDPARETIRNIFLKKIIYAKGMSKVQQMIDGILMPTPSAVLNSASLLSVGSDTEAGIGELMVIDVGGATTDVYSIADGKPAKAGTVEKGLPEPFAKRTVEGDLGVRYSSSALVEAAGLKKTAEKSGLPEETFLDCLAKVNRQPDILPSGEEDMELLDFGLAAAAVKIATDRHAGKLETVYTPFGAIYAQTGKDLTRVSTVLGTGGPIIYGINPEGVLEEAVYSNESGNLLKPLHVEFVLDRKYIMAAMGLLGERYPETALRIMKKELYGIQTGKKINLKCCV